MSVASNLTGVVLSQGASVEPYAVTAEGTEPPSRFDKIIEIVAVLLLGITTVGTAWCGFQSVQWSGASSSHAQAASDKHVEAARLFGLATQTIAYDSGITAKYAQAASAGDTELQDFYRKSLVRKDFLPVLDAWEAEVKAGRNPTPLADDTDYLASQLAGYQAMIASAEEETRQGIEAGTVASTYVSVTILLAAALFFSGVISSFKYRAARALLLAAALTALGVAASRLASLPVLF